MIFFALLPPLTRKVGPMRVVWAECVDRRIKFTSSVLRHIKAIKLSAYEPRILALADGMRNDEMNAFVRWVKEILKVSILTNWLANFLSLVTVMTFTLLTILKPGATEGISTARIFTVISTIDLISGPLLDLGQKMGSLLTAWASLKRIEGFLLDGEKVSDNPSVPRRGEGQEQGERGMRIELENATFGVQGKIDLLHGLTVRMDEPGLWMITGRVGCVRPHCPIRWPSHWLPKASSGLKTG